MSSGFQLGSGARAVANLKTFQQGMLEETNRPLDVAIEGEGFFASNITTTNCVIPETGRSKSTATSPGHLSGVSGGPPITFPDNASQICIGRNGVVSATIAGQTQAQNVGQLTISRFPNICGLSSEGSNLFRKTAASGEPIDGTPSQSGTAICCKIIWNVQMSMSSTKWSN